MAERRSIHIEGLSHLTAIPVASRIGPLVMSSIIAPFNPGTRDVPDTIDAQVSNIFEHVASMLEASGRDLGRHHQDELLGPHRCGPSRHSKPHGSSTSRTTASRPARHTQVSSDVQVILADFTAYVT